MDKRRRKPPRWPKIAKSGACHSTFCSTHRNGALWFSRGGSQSGSQRAQPLSHVRRCQASVVPGERHARRCRASSGVWLVLIWEQEAAGSNPAIPTAFFECVLDNTGSRNCSDTGGSCPTPGSGAVVPVRRSAAGERGDDVLAEGGDGVRRCEVAEPDVRTLDALPGQGGEVVG